MDIKCSVFIATSLDGYIARANGDIDWLTGEGETENGEDYGFQEFFASIDTLIMGRKTYEQVLTFEEWMYGEKRVVVLSSGSPHIPKDLAGNVEIMTGAPNEVVQRLSNSGARHLYIDGGATIQGFLRAGLIDELTITRLPILIGEGIPLFGGLIDDVHMEHLGTQSYEVGLVESRYRVLKGDE